MGDSRFGALGAPVTCRRVSGVLRATEHGSVE